MAADAPTYGSIVAEAGLDAARTVDGAAQYAAVGAVGMAGLAGVAVGLSAAGATYATTHAPRNLGLAAVAGLTGTSLDGVEEKEVVPFADDPHLAAGPDDPDRGVRAAVEDARERGNGLRARLAEGVAAGVVAPAERATGPSKRLSGAFLDGCEWVADRLVDAREGVLRDERSTPERIRDAVEALAPDDDGSRETESVEAEPADEDVERTGVTDLLVARVEGEDGEECESTDRSPERD